MDKLKSLPYKRPAAGPLTPLPVEIIDMRKEATAVRARRILQYVSKMGKKEILNCLRGVNISAADFNPDKVARIARRKAKGIGRPVKREEREELLTTITAMY